MNIKMSIICYEDCKPGYTSQDDGLCYLDCPDGMIGFGMSCVRKTYYKGNPYLTQKECENSGGRGAKTNGCEKDISWTPKCDPTYESPLSTVCRSTTKCPSFMKSGNECYRRAYKRKPLVNCPIPPSPPNDNGGDDNGGKGDNGDNKLSLNNKILIGVGSFVLLMILFLIYKLQ